MNLLKTKKTMKMDGKKKTKMTVFVNVETKMNVKNTFEAKASLKMKMNMKKMMNAAPQMGMRCCRFTGDVGDQIKSAEVEGAAIRRRFRRSPRQKYTASHSGSDS
jgi:hypothetical protein